MAPPTLTRLRHGWNGTFNIQNTAQTDESHMVERNKIFTGNVKLSALQVRFLFNGKDPDGRPHANHITSFSLVYIANDDALEIWWGGNSGGNEIKIPVSGASKVLLNLDEHKSGVLGVILLDDNGNIKFWENYYDIAKRVGN